MDLFSIILQFLGRGGPFMYPIGIVLVLGLAITLERWVFLTRAHRENRKMWEELQAMVGRGEVEQAGEVAARSNSAVGKVLALGLARAHGRSSRQEMESAMEESLLEVTPLLEKRTHYLATFANIATLLGLLGTIIGLIQGFSAVANVDPAEKANLLSASISIAMNTTAFGLMVAIPLLLLHTFLTTKTNDLIDSLEMASVKFVNALSREG
ncbi:MotA/TolQ/ExbB proton channel family protein [Algiphilus sp.]|uniref:MotA/TolQ/ExbB proton channel family protein n=1 Tax=Algiphilus sp. TaxID=1872431 RepID=UPI0025C2ACF1|nr:MotA/TolQ/ExbB proton channel family protein [Algiphilus sp.]MCK5771684.1 MotA/TolQ/ExbB proton channel family protein [Algiphilus sp.]